MERGWAQVLLSGLLAVRALSVTGDAWMVTTCKLVLGEVMHELSPEPMDISLVLKNAHLLFALIYVLVSEAKATESNNFAFLLPDLVMVILAVKLEVFQMFKKHIF